MPNTRPTQRDVAAAAGVSDMTVSRVLRGTGYVSGRTKAHVLNVVSQLGYVQNRLAGSLSSSRSNQVAVVIPSIVNNLFSQVAAGVAEELKRADYNPVMGVSDYNTDTEESLLTSMMAWRPAGVIVTDFVHTDRTRKILTNAGVPVVEIGEISGQPIDMCVGLNHADSARAMVDHLLDKGYRRFGYLGWNDTEYAAGTRYQTVKEHLAATGLPLTAPSAFDQSPDFDTGKSALANLLQSKPDLDVVVFSNDVSACGGLIHCLEHGIPVPERLAIAGFGGLRLGQSMPRALTTILSKRYDIGRRAARAILNALVGQEVPKVVDLGFELIPGASS